MRLRFLEPLTDNPIFTRELRRRMRGKMMMYSTNAFIALMCLATFFIITMPTLMRTGGGAVQGAEVGARLFSVLTFIQAVLVLLIAPVITSGMATVERERKTFEFLKVTTLSPFTFVLGGLMSTMLYVLIVLICALPLICISFLYGGVAPREIGLMTIKLLGAALLLSAAGLWISSTRDRTKSAQSATLVLVIVAFGFGYSNWQNLFAAGTGRALALPALPFAIPMWVLHLAAIIVASSFLLLIAGRKLYTTDNRPLTYRHSLLILALAVAAILGPMWGENTIAHAREWVFLSYPLMFLLVVTQCLHRLEIGSEVWALKKRWPILRGVDESIPFVLLFAGAWAVAGWAWSTHTTIPAGTGVPTLDTIGSVTPLAFGQMAATLVLAAVLARYFAYASASRADAFRGVMWSSLILFLVVPMVGYLVLVQTKNPDNLLGAILFMLGPWGGLEALGFADPQAISTFLRAGGTNMDVATGAAAMGGAIVVLGLLAIGIAAFHLRRHRHDDGPIDYSYPLTT